MLSNMSVGWNVPCVVFQSTGPSSRRPEIPGAQSIVIQMLPFENMEDRLGYSRNDPLLVDDSLSVRGMEVGRKGYKGMQLTSLALFTDVNKQRRSPFEDLIGLLIPGGVIL
jgi:hypothetical protein